MATDERNAHFVYDLDGNIIAEYDAGGTLLREYVWLEERPLAVVDHSGTSPAIYHVHADHLGRPIMMTDNAKAVVWEASFLPFGAVVTLSGPASLDYRTRCYIAGMVTGEVARFQKEINPATSLTLYRGSLLLSDCFGEKQRCLTILRACYTPTLSFDNFVSSLSSKPSLPI